MDVERLIELMARLRDPAGGCPWDREQTFETVAPYTVEEAYEVLDAIDHGDMAELKAELGDLLFQVVFHARMAEEAGQFAFGDVVAAVVDKMTRRHPHVFGDAEVRDAEDQTRAWEAQKAAERAEKGPASVLDGVARSLPALSRAEKVQKRVARVGFDWPDAAGVLDKLEEELGELREAVAGGRTAEVQAELGDLLFTCVNLARHVEADPERALRRANDRFEGRFRQVEAGLRAEGREPDDADLAELDARWEAVKQQR